MTRNRTTPKFIRLTGLAVALAGVAMMSIPAAGLASGPVKFGSQLDPTVQPSNSLPAHPCSQDSPGTPCTMIQNEAYGRPDGGQYAPRTGTIKRIRVIAGGPGSFRLQVAKVKLSTLQGTNEAKIVAGGPKISYQGQSDANWDSGSYRVESFKVNVPVKKGQQLALRGNYTSMVRCSSGGDNTLIYQPALLQSGGFSPASDTDGCWLLMEAVIR
ncbi:MAG TPA: hypothetical protein VF176_10670 [Solirubrobacterales bacterium]